MSGEIPEDWTQALYKEDPNDTYSPELYDVELLHVPLNSATVFAWSWYTPLTL